MSNQHYERPPTLLGIPSWNGQVVGVIDDADAARHAVADLHAAGFMDARWRPGAEILANHDAFIEHRGRLQKLVDILAAEEWSHIEEYLEEMRRGANFLTVTAAVGDAAQRASDIQRRHGGHHIHGYDSLTIAEL
jgi:hypothetical protein